jgi:hypothetical protein
MPAPSQSCNTAATRRVARAVFFSSFAYSGTISTTAPWNFSGQWHISQVLRAG